MVIELTHQNGMNKQAQSVLSMIGKFKESYESAKRKPPEQTHIKKKDAEILEKALEANFKRKKEPFDKKAVWTYEGVQIRVAP